MTLRKDGIGKFTWNNFELIWLEVCAVESLRRRRGFLVEISRRRRR